MKKQIYLFLTCALIAIAVTNTKAQTISSSTTTLDSMCGMTTVTINVAGCISGLTVKTFYGDGTFSTGSVYCGGSIGYAYNNHYYAASGVYTVKNILYSGTVALDSTVYSHNFHFCRNFPIGSYLDVNTNCIFDAGDFNTYSSGTVEIDSAGIPIDTIPFYGGLWYPAYGAAGTIYAFKMLSAPAGLIVSCPSTGIIYDTIPPLPTDTVRLKSFAFVCGSSSSFNLGVTASFVPAVTGGLANRATIIVHNSNCTGTSATVKFEFSPKYSFGSISAPAATYSYTVSGTSVTVNVGSVSAYAPKIFYVHLTPTVTLTMGDTVNSKFTVNPISGDSDPTNNIVVRCDTVRASYDPNHKSVTPTGYITAGTTLEYMLEFENDGNDTAHNIHVMDTLSNYLDINTLKGGISSHKVEIIKYYDAGQNILKFDFPNIMLPDSTHHDVCRGMVTFSIKAKTTLALGTVIANRVGIYFDTNPVVMTNTVFSKIPLPSGVKSNSLLSQVELYPNPVHEELTIKTDGGAYKTLAIYNIMGQLVSTQDITQSEVKVDVHSLTPGMYYVSFKGLSGTKTMKFEKL